MRKYIIFMALLAGLVSTCSVFAQQVSGPDVTFVNKNSASFSGNSHAVQFYLKINGSLGASASPWTSYITEGNSVTFHRAQLGSSGTPSSFDVYITDVTVKPLQWVQCLSGVGYNANSGGTITISGWTKTQGETVSASCSVQ